MSPRNERKQIQCLKRKYGKSEGITEGRIKLHDEELHDFYSAPILLE
jgi:hypothetical protein